MNFDFLNQPATSQRKPARRERPLVLSVDDDLNTLYARYRLLESAGYGVLSATDGEQALRIFYHDIIDLVLLDFTLQGMNGGLVAEAMRAAAPDVPVVMVSGTDVPERYLAMCHGYVRKGDGPEALLGIIAQLLSPASKPAIDRSLNVS